MMWTWAEDIGPARPQRDVHFAARSTTCRWERCSRSNLGIVLWIVYGFAIEALPVIFANVVTLVLTAILLLLKLRCQPPTRG